MINANGSKGGLRILNKAFTFSKTWARFWEIAILSWRLFLSSKVRSAEKRHRQSEERRIRNKAVKSSVRTSAKKFVLSTRKKDAGESELLLRDMIQKIDSAARKGIIKKNAAARKKSRMQRLLNTMKAAQ